MKGMKKANGDAIRASVGTSLGEKLRVRWESQDWAQAAGEFASRNQRRVASGPYQAAIPAQIANLQFALPAATIAEAADAEAAIVRFDETVDRELPQLAGAELSPLTAVLLRTESASSSQIEHITAGSRALALAVIDERAGVNAQLVAANVAAMQAAVGLAESFDNDSVLAAHAALLGRSKPDIAGQFRDTQVWVGGRGATPHTATFVPPHAARVDASMRDLVEFTRRTDIPPLTQAAIAHAQFETIHPFPDGNGRVGRVIVHALLRQYGLTRRLTVPVSAGLLADTSSYFDALTAYRDGDATPIVSRFTQAAFRALSNGRRLAQDLSGILGRWSAMVTARRDAAAWKLMPLLLTQPAVTSKAVALWVGVSQPAADGAIAHLQAAGVLAPVSAAQRDRVWVAPMVLDALDDFATRAGRRG